ncbi:MAG: hypothetical protein J4478_05135 [Candidatus Diapherotrites archaeon]|uniref:Uncharacterized protein n=1 Tax=Candidatus Iainarchaeum sp. TaxID=3101447 RepID=A0A8T4L523_9ARCH|nr:hypothetical protein [Candidatus Diapherotrites archaeon]
MKPESYWKINVGLLIGCFVIVSLFLLPLILFGTRLPSSTLISFYLTYGILLAVFLCLWLLPLIAAIQVYRKKASGFYLAMASSIELLIIYLMALLLPVLQTIVYYF